MLRISVFLATALGSLAAIGFVNWWLDPAGDRYFGGPVAAALAHSPQCFVSVTVLKPPVWTSFKLDLFRRRKAATVVVGTSRVAKVGARAPGERFANLGVPGTGPAVVVGLFRRLHDEHPRPLTVYLGADTFWFKREWKDGVTFQPDRLGELRRLLSAETARETFDVLRRAPGAIRHPGALRAWNISRFPRGCAVDEGSSVADGTAQAWGPDGTLYFEPELARTPRERGADLFFLFATKSPRLDGGRVEQLGEALQLAERWRWRVVGFLPPVSDGMRARIAGSPPLRAEVARYRDVVPRLFARHGFTFLDLLDVRSVPCRNDDFSFADGLHAGVACGQAIRARLDAALSPP
jgi:hypothetical protein